MAKVSVKFRDKEVRNPFLRGLIIAIGVLAAVVIMPLALVVGLFVVFPLALILQPFLVLFGRKGTIRQEGRKLSIAIDREAFRKANNGS